MVATIKSWLIKFTDYRRADGVIDNEGKQGSCTEKFGSLEELDPFKHNADGKPSKVRYQRTRHQVLIMRGGTMPGSSSSKT